MANTSFYGLTGTTATVQNTIQASVDAAATSATNSATSETNSATSAAASLASKNAAATSAAAALVSQNAAAGSASTAAGHVSSTAADAVATAADRVQTGTDKTGARAAELGAVAAANTVANDAAQVATDAAQVASDKIATAADRVATGQDVTSSAASATSASNSASTATAQAALATSNGAAQVALATTQATNASNSASASAISAAASAASAISTGNDATQTAADRVQTGLDRTAAATSATDAATAKTAAETALDNFTDQYLGPQASVPSTDLDGDPLQTGSLVYDTSAGVMKIWNGSAWEAAYVTQSGSGALLASNNLSDLNSASTGRVNLGLGTAATTAATDYATAAQGALAASALQSGDNVSTLTNDSGYITSVPAQSFASLTGKPTTIAGYGITDAFDGAFGSLTGTPTTIAGYGITDAFDGAFSSLSGKPTTIAGYGITDTFFDGAYGSLTGTPTIPTNNNQLTNGAGYITSVPAQSFASLTGKPTTVAGYGITDVTSQFSAGSGISISGGTISSTVTDTNTTYSAGSGLNLSGTTFSHSDTSSQGSVNNSGRTYIQDITLDTYGHVTGIATATETVVNTDTTYSAGSGISISGTTITNTAQGSTNASLISSGTLAQARLPSTLYAQTKIRATWEGGNSGTKNVLDSFGLSSMYDFGTGKVRLNFSARPNIYFSPAMSCRNTNSNATHLVIDAGWIPSTSNLTLIGVQMNINAATNQTQASAIIAGD